MKHSGLLLCSPGRGLGCVACCPPIRPAGYDHADHPGSLRRLLAENTRALREQGPPTKPITGYWCPGLGFLDPSGRQAGCLLHPALNQGQDLRGPTGFQEKCARESCPPARAFAALGAGERDALLDLCEGLESLAFGSPRLNPVMRLLAFGPEVAACVAWLGLRRREDLAAWPWLGETPPAWGWLLARRLEAWGEAALTQAGLAQRLATHAQALARRLGPEPPMEQGQPLHTLCGEWEARAWQHLSGRRRVRPADLARWREMV